MDVHLRVSPSEITFNNKTLDLDSVARSMSVITKLANSEVISCKSDFFLANTYSKPATYLSRYLNLVLKAYELR